jgi:hypothetical protein
MTITGDVLMPLPYEDAPTGTPSADELSARSLDDAPDTTTRELAPDLPPMNDAEGVAPLMGSPVSRPRYPDPTGNRGLEADTSRPSVIPGDDAGTRDIPDVLLPPVAPPDPRVVPIDAATGQKISEVVTKKDLATLKKAISDLYERTTTELAPNSAKAALALGWLSEARAIGLGRPEQYPMAELRVAQTRTLLEQFKQSHEAVAQHARGLVVANIGWLILFGALFFWDQWVQAGGFPALNLKAVSDIFPPWLCVLAGGLGGALAALVALGRVISRREFNADDNLDYYLNGLKGALLGGVTYYLILGGFVTAAATSGVNVAAGMEGGSLLDSMQAGASESPLFIVIAFVAGLAQQRLLGLLGRIWNQRTGDSDPTPNALPTDDLAHVPVPAADVPVAIDVQEDGEQLPQPTGGGAG